VQEGQYESGMLLGEPQAAYICLTGFGFGPLCILYSLERRSQQARFELPVCYYENDTRRHTHSVTHTLSHMVSRVTTTSGPRMAFINNKLGGLGATSSHKPPLTGCGEAPAHEAGNRKQRKGAHTGSLVGR
jgi:hypothetical protein